MFYARERLPKIRTNTKMAIITAPVNKFASACFLLSSIGLSCQRP